jgi:hypothetical protein
MMGLIGTKEQMVTVYRFKVYDIIDDVFRPSRRLATEKRIEEIGAIKDGGAIRIPARDLDGDSMTNIGYQPPLT